MTDSMKAVVVSEVKGPWLLQNRARQTAGPGQVLVRVRACAICGTDLWLAHGTLKFRDFPLVLGHEGVGEVVAIGDGVTARRVGDRVGMPMMQASCGRCDFCRERHVNSFVSDPAITQMTLALVRAMMFAILAVKPIIEVFPAPRCGGRRASAAFGAVRFKAVVSY